MVLAIQVGQCAHFMCKSKIHGCTIQTVPTLQARKCVHYVCKSKIHRCSVELLLFLFFFQSTCCLFMINIMCCNPYWSKNAHSRSNCNNQLCTHTSDFYKHSELWSTLAILGESIYEIYKQFSIIPCFFLYFFLLYTSHSISYHGKLWQWTQPKNLAWATLFLINSSYLVLRLVYVLQLIMSLILNPLCTLLVENFFRRSMVLFQLFIPSSVLLYHTLIPIWGIC